MSESLVQVAELMQRETGIAIKAAQLPSLASALRRVDPTLTATDFLLAGTGTVDAATLLSRMIDEVTIKETFFFRQRLDLDAIDWPGLVGQARASGSGHARVWVAATASGEEAYTLAILASEAFAPHPPPVMIHATDISAAVLARAQRGRYGLRSTRALEESVLNRYFTREGPDVVVAEPLRRIVRFSRQNLVGQFVPAAGGPFDLIVCRNVLIYFEPDVVERVVAGLTQALAPHGRLLLGAADRLSCSASKLVRLGRSEAAWRPAGQPAKPAPVLRRPLGREAPDKVPAPSSIRSTALSAELEEALRAANWGDLKIALEVTTRALDRDPLDTNAYFIRGLTQRGLGRHADAIGAFRSALYVDPEFWLAAFEMGRSQEACGDRAGAARAYSQALAALNRASRESTIDNKVDAGDVAAACAIRLQALNERSAGRRSHDSTGGTP